MYGYGLKSMMLSMIETACRITGGKENLHCAEEIIRLGQELLQKPVTLLDGVENVLLQLQGKYKLVLATKGDLFDQKRKVMDSGLVRYFCHIEIMSDKKEADYQKLLNKVGCAPQNFLMLGNSIKSDILPILNLGGYAAIYLITLPGNTKTTKERNSSQFPSIEKYQRYNRVSPIIESPSALVKTTPLWNRLSVEG